MLCDFRLRLVGFVVEDGGDPLGYLLRHLQLLGQFVPFVMGFTGFLEMDNGFSIPAAHLLSSMKKAALVWTA